MPKGSSTWQRAAPGSESSGRGSWPAARRRSSSAPRSSTTRPGCALRAGANGSSTPTWSSCSPTRNQQPPRAAQRLRLRQLLEAEQLAVERARRRLAPGRRRDLHVVDADDRHPKGLPSTAVAQAQPQLEDTLVSGYARLASDAPNRRIDLELRVLDIALASVDRRHRAADRAGARAGRARHERPPHALPRPARRPRRPLLHDAQVPHARRRAPRSGSGSSSARSSSATPRPS